MFTHVLDSHRLYNHASYILSHFIGDKTGGQTPGPTSHSQETVNSHLDTSQSDNQAIMLSALETGLFIC